MLTSVHTSSCSPRHKLQERQQEWTQAHHELEAAQHAKHMQHEKHADEQWQQLTVTCVELDKRLTATAQEHTERREEMHQTLVRSHATLEERHIKQGERLNAAISSNSKEIDLLKTSTGSSVEDLQVTRSAPNPHLILTKSSSSSPHRHHPHLIIVTAQGDDTADETPLVAE